MKCLSEETFLTDAQLKYEMNRCEYCEEKPCREACPANCSPADFIMAAREGDPQDYRRSAAIIMKDNPLGGVCGAVCPDQFCLAACSRKLFDGAIHIPAVQATIVQKAKELGGIPAFVKPAANGRKVAVIGAGPAGLAAAALLAQRGYQIDIFERETKPGGMCNLIPNYRLDKKALATDIDFVLSLGKIRIFTKREILCPEALLENHDAVLVAAGLWQPMLPDILHQELAVDSIAFLRTPRIHSVKGMSVGIIGGGSVAADCAVTARLRGARRVELFALEKLSEMPLTRREMSELIARGIDVSCRTRVVEVLKSGKKIAGLRTIKVRLSSGARFNVAKMEDVPGTEQRLRDVDFVIVAIGSRPEMKRTKNSRVFVAGDYVNGPTTVVQACAAGKNIALKIDAALSRKDKPSIERNVKSRISLGGYVRSPVSLESDFFGRKITSPFILSAAPPTDGLDQMRRAYGYGWAGGIIKTAFDGIPIHIPGEYMHAFNKDTYGNFDNVSGRPLDRVCREVESLVQEFPDRLTMASTGGPVSGNDGMDKNAWQSNTRKLESAGAMGIEYSLSCPQGGDGTEGDMVSQNAALTAKIADWVMEAGRPEIPKLFKLTSAVTSIMPVANAIREVFARYPGKKAGITLANTFPTLFFRKGEKKEWEEGVIVGMSGEGVLPISYLTLAQVSSAGLEVSGNGGVMSYKAAANFLALGVNTVQVCTIVLKYGYGIIDELISGLGSLMFERGISSVAELRGMALPKPIRDFMSFPSIKKISDFNYDLCVSCGNCTRCGYLAIAMDGEHQPGTDPERCIGCALCQQKCFTGAIFLRDRTKRESALLKEA